MVSLKKPIWTVSSSVLTRTDDHSFVISILLVFFISLAVVIYFNIF